MKTFSIAGITIPNRYVQAPLAGYSTFAMRALAYKFGAGLTYTEMTSSNALDYNSFRTFEMLPKEKEPGLLALQLFGSDKNTIYSAVKYLNDHAVYDFLDFNFGCPAKKVLRQKAGSYWLKDPDGMYALMREIVTLSSRPVIAKIRLGFDDINGLQVAKLLEEAGVKALAVHGRTTKEGFSGPVHYDVIKQIKEEVSIPVIANGSISLDNFKEVEEATGADAFMFGREALGNPKLFEDLIRKESGEEIRMKTLKEQLLLIKEHLNLLIDEKGEELACVLMRGISTFYLKGLDNVKQTKIALVRCSKKQDYLDIVDPLLSRLS